MTERHLPATRARTLNEILEILGSPTRAPLVALTGPAGIGRSAMLVEIRKSLNERGVRVVTVQSWPNVSSLPPDLACHPGVKASLVGSVHVRDDANPAARVLPGAGPITGPVPLLTQGNVVVLIDDAQGLDLEALDALEALVRQCAGTTVGFVCAVRLPAPAGITAAGRAALDRLRRDGLARVVNLRPLAMSEITALVADRLRAKPDPALIRCLRRMSGGVPAAVEAAVEEFQRADAIRVADSHAYLVRPHLKPTLPENHQLVAPVRRLGSSAWSVAKAIAALSPLGAAAVPLTGSALGMFDRDVRRVLDTLRQEGVVRFVRATGAWRFRMPLLAETLIACLGPYERRHLAQVAVTALWDGTAQCDDPKFLPDQLANAGRLVDPERAGAELLAHAYAALSDDGERAQRWLRAAAELTTDPERRAVLLIMQASACFARSAYRSSLISSGTVLRESADRLPADLLQEVQIMHLTSLHGIGELTELEKIAADEQPWPAQPAQWTVTRAAALSALDRWREAGTLLATTRETWQSNAVSAFFGDLYGALAGLWQGEPEQFEKRLAIGDQWPLDERYRFERASAHLRSLLIVGDLSRAEQQFATEDFPFQRLRFADQSMVAMLGGRFDEALDLARRSIASHSAFGFDSAHVALHQTTATILLSRGKLMRARELLAEARSGQPVLPHLLAGPEAAVDRILGEPEQARGRLLDGLELASDRGLIVDTETLWFALGELALGEGDIQRARQYVAEIERVATKMQTSRAALYHLLARAAVEQDRDSASEAVQLARERNQPFELACVIDTSVRHGVGDPAQLHEAYELFGALGALLYRARLRNRMRMYGIGVPGRRTTVAENERLLAVLVAEGLGNRQIATVFETSEKSVEGRLSRLFSRTGYRSRVELAAAMLTGEYPE